jgi:flagellar assembly protein FliH
MSPAALSEYSLEQLEPSAPPAPPGSPERLRAEAIAQADQIRERARAEGHAEGLAHGRQVGLADSHAAAQALVAALSELDLERAQLSETVERDAVELALALAAKILSATLEVQPERVLDIVSGALRRFNDRRQLTVLVDPEDLELVSASIGELTTQAGGVEQCDVQADRRVGRGGAIVRSHEREVDVSVETQLDHAREAIASQLGRGESNDER